jgi:outer membrane cobalamin receptor
VAAYRANIDGMILWQPDFQFVWSPSNFDVRRSGWEASGRLSVPSVRADAHASISRSVVDYVGPVLSGQVVYRPAVTAEAAAGITRWNTRAEIDARYVGARRTVPGSALNVLDPYSLADIKVARAFVYGAWQLDATIGVDNVLDRHAAMLVDYPFPGRTWTISFRTRRKDDGAAVDRVAARP